MPICNKALSSISSDLPIRAPTPHFPVQLNCNQILCRDQLPCCYSLHPFQERFSVESYRTRGTAALWGRSTEQGGFSVWDIQENPPSWHFFTTHFTQLIGSMQTGPFSDPSCQQEMPHRAHHSLRLSKAQHRYPMSAPTAKEATGSFTPKASSHPSRVMEKTLTTQPLPLHALWASNAHKKPHSCALKDNPDLCECFEIRVAKAECFSYYVPRFT